MFIVLLAKQIVSHDFYSTYYPMARPVPLTASSAPWEAYEQIELLSITYSQLAHLMYYICTGMFKIYKNCFIPFAVVF